MNLDPALFIENAFNLCQYMQKKVVWCFVSFFYVFYVFDFDLFWEWHEIKKDKHLKWKKKKREMKIVYNKRLSFFFKLLKRREGANDNFFCWILFFFILCSFHLLFFCFSFCVVFETLLKFFLFWKKEGVLICGFPPF